MSLGPRIFLSLVLSSLILIGLIKLNNLPADKLLPPAMLYKNATARAHGVVTDKQSKQYGDHIFEGDDVFYYAVYSFKPYKESRDERGRRVVSEYPSDVTGWARVDKRIYDALANGQAVEVYFDPENPVVNGVLEAMPPTGNGVAATPLGDEQIVWSKFAGFQGPYLWWYVGLIVMTYVLQEIIRSITKTNDLR